MHPASWVPGQPGRPALSGGPAHPLFPGLSTPPTCAHLQCPSCRPPLDALLDALPPLAARAYSISCSPLEHPSKVGREGQG